MSSTIGCFHDAGAAPGTDDKAPRSWAERERPGCNLMRELACFLIIARHLQQALGVTRGCAVFRQSRSRHPRSFLPLQPSAARLRGFMRFDARLAEHDDGVGDALLLELHQAASVLAENADRPGGPAGQQSRV